MSYIHYVVSYVILQRAFGHMTTTLAYEFTKYFLYISYCSVCVTLSTGYSYIFKNNQEQQPLLTRLDSIDFEVDSDKEEDYVIIRNTIEKKDY